jgi:hypothetical protein
VDLAKAYDSVPRDLLWQRLHEVGVDAAGRIVLHAVKGVYDVGVDMHIKTPAGTLDPVHTSVGVKQGPVRCRLPCLGCTALMASTEHYVAAACPNARPRFSVRCTRSAA